MPSNGRPKGSGPNTRNLPVVTPMSERQQMALLMQMTSSSGDGGGNGSRSPSSSSSASSSSNNSKTRDRNERGWTPLHEASNHGWYEVAARLIQSGANINAKETNSSSTTTTTTSTTSTRGTPLRSRDDKKMTTTSSDKSKSEKTSNSETMENKTISPTMEDVYEFKSVKENESSSSSSSAEKNTENGGEAENDTSTIDPLSIPLSNNTNNNNADNNNEPIINKRAHSEVEAGNNEDSEKDEENKKKKRKEDSSGKESGKAPQRQNKSQNSKQTANTSGKHSTSSSSSTSKTSTVVAEKKSPENSPKPSSVAASSDAEEGSSNSGDGKNDLKVPPLKIVIPQSSANEHQETGTSRNSKSNSQRTHQALPYVVSSNSNDSTDKETATGVNSPENSSNSKDGDKNKDTQSSSAEEPTTNNAETEANNSANNGNVSATAATTAAAAAAPAAPVVELHPRKRKMKQSREQSNNNQVQQQNADNADSSAEGRDVHPHDQPITNCYKLFSNIREQIEERRKGLFLVQPKPPQGFNNYLMNRCTYVLANSAPTTPNINYPPSLPTQLKDLFAEQEKERYRLRMQHVVEKEKLVLSVEQEILRVHGRAARALANQSLPFSVCTILRDEEVYNLITPEQEEKDRNARSRHNGRLFLSWLQDVDDKWEKIKEHMLLRHHHEAESLHAVQKMNWEWKLKELIMCDRKSTPKIDELHVPEVHVSDDFDLLPA